MGYVTDDDGEDTDGPATHGSPSRNLAMWAICGFIVTYVFAITGIVMIVGMTMFAPMNRDRPQVAGNGQSFTASAPAVQPGNFARVVEGRTVAMRVAEARDLDLRVTVEAPPELSAEDVAGQATELANRLRCRVEVRHEGKVVKAWPGIGREIFLEQVESDARTAERRP